MEEEEGEEGSGMGRVRCDGAPTAQGLIYGLQSALVVVGGQVLSTVSAPFEAVYQLARVQLR